MFGRLNEEVLSQQQLENRIAERIKDIGGPLLFQSSSQNIDRLVSFYKAALRLGRLFVVDVYTANIMQELAMIGNKLPHSCEEFDNIRVFYPHWLTQKIFKEIGEEYAKRFSSLSYIKERTA